VKTVWKEATVTMTMEPNQVAVKMAQKEAAMTMEQNPRELCC